MKKTIFLTTIAALMIFAASCGQNAQKKTAAEEPQQEVEFVGEPNNAQQLSADIDELWNKLNGYWKYIITTAPDPDNPQYIFCYFGYNDDNKPISYIVWGYEISEIEYATEVIKLDEHRFRVTFEVPAKKEEGLHEIHDAYTITQDYNLSNYSNKKLTMESSENSSEWKYIGTEFPEDIFED